MEKEFVPYPLALRLKALGFDEPYFAFFNGKHLDFNVWDWEYPAGQKRRDIGECPIAPTFSQAFRWFREKYNLDHEISYAGKPGGYHAFVKGYVYGNNGNSPSIFSYEQAEIACLDKLIEIVEGIESQK